MKLFLILGAAYVVFVNPSALGTGFAAEIDKLKRGFHLQHLSGGHALNQRRVKAKMQAGEGGGGAANVTTSGTRSADYRVPIFRR